MTNQQGAPEALRQILLDPENQPNQYGVQFLMHGPKMTARHEAFEQGVLKTLAAFRAKHAARKEGGA